MRDLVRLDPKDSRLAPFIAGAELTTWLAQLGFDPAEVASAVVLADEGVVEAMCYVKVADGRLAVKGSHARLEIFRSDPDHWVPLPEPIAQALAVGHA